MHPILFYFPLGERWLPVPAYGTAMVLAIVTIALVGWAIATRRQLPRWPSLVCSTLMAMALPIGSRILYWVMNSELRQTKPDLLVRAEFNGFFLAGGLALAVAVGALVCRLVHVDFWRIADAIAPAMGLGGAVLRVGCFLNGCCFGRPTSLPWGVRFPAGSPAHLHQAAQRLDVLFAGTLPTHPTQLYEIAGSLIAAIIAMIAMRRRAPDGVAALAAGLWFAAFRWVNSLFRAFDPTRSWPAEVTALLYAAVVVLCTALLWWRLLSGATRPRREHL